MLFNKVDFPTFGNPAITTLTASKLMLGMFFSSRFAKSKKSSSSSILFTTDAILPNASLRIGIALNESDFLIFVVYCASICLSTPSAQ